VTRQDFAATGHRTGRVDVGAIVADAYRTGHSLVIGIRRLPLYPSNDAQHTGHDRGSAVPAQARVRRLR